MKNGNILFLAQLDIDKGQFNCNNEENNRIKFQHRYTSLPVELTKYAQNLDEC